MPGGGVTLGASETSVLYLPLPPALTAYSTRQPTCSTLLAPPEVATVSGCHVVSADSTCISTQCGRL